MKVDTDSKLSFLDIMLLVEEQSLVFHARRISQDNFLRQISQF